MKMKREINTWNGSGWNNYPGLRTPIVLPRGARGYMADQGIAEIRIEPYDSEKPLGIAVRYIDDDGECIWTTRHGQNNTGADIRECIMDALEEGIHERKKRVQRQYIIEAFKARISQWRRGFPEPPQDKRHSGIDRLSVKFHQARKRAATIEQRPSRKLCTSLASDVCRGAVAFANAKAIIENAGGVFNSQQPTPKET
jgi:SpoVK/Ycf46/Vps4 family AAA+-type ATPase